jgi:multiple sugar transport system permease protein
VDPLKNASFDHLMLRFSSSPIRYLVIYALLGVWSLVCLFPLYWVAITTLKQPRDIINGPVYAPFLDFKPTLESWTYILFNPEDDTWRRYGNSLLVAIAAAGLTVIIGGLGAYGLARFRPTITVKAIGAPFFAAILCISMIAAGMEWRLAASVGTAFLVLTVAGRRQPGRAIASDQIAFAILATRVLPPVVTAIPIYVMAQSLGQIDSWSALIVTYVATNLPLAVWLLRDVVEAVPRHVEEAAELDGASRLRILLTITLPLARVGIISVAALMFIFCWNEYTFAAMLTTDHALTMPPFLAGQMATREQMAGAEPQWGYFSVLITIMVAPLAIGAGLLQRLISRAFLGASSTESLQ